MIVVVMGVSGSGKTTVGGRLAEALQFRFVDGDVLHPPANIEKMRSGIPLTDADRAPWLAALHQEIAAAWSRGEDLVVAASALKQSHRAVLAGDVPITWVHLQGSAELIQSRVRNRTGHFMNPRLLASQFETLQEPDDAIDADASQPPDAIVRGVAGELRERRKKGRTG